MAGENGNKTKAVVFLQDIQQTPYRFGFFQTVRRINCHFDDMALTGTAFRPSEDPVYFGQTPYTNFASFEAGVELPEAGG